MSWLSDLFNKLFKRNVVVPTPPTPKPVVPEPIPPTPPIPPTNDKNLMLDLHNSVRSNKLEFDDSLNTSAQKWAERMDYKDMLIHSDIDRIINGSLLWWEVGENIAFGNITPEQIFKMWMRSSGHKKNITNENFTHIGIGKSGDYWCVQFGEKR